MSIIGSNVLLLPVVDSTNAYIQRELSLGFLPEGWTVAAGEQTAGKGQRGTQWISEANRNILMSVLLYPAFLQADKQFYLSMAMALGAADFVQGLLPGKKVELKWPNDILVEGKKVGGILIENSIQGNILKNSIVGIGINVGWAPPDNTSWPAGALSDFGNMPEPAELLPVLCTALDKKYAELRAGNYSTLKEEYLDRLHGLGQYRIFKDLVNGGAFEGSISGIDGFGRLLVDQLGGVKEYSLKEIGFVA